MLYGKGLPEEERLHAAFHNSHATAFRFPGWSTERVVLRDGCQGRLLAVTPADPVPHLRKVGEICAALERALGLPQGYLTAPAPEYKVFLWVSHEVTSSAAQQGATAAGRGAGGIGSANTAKASGGGRGGRGGGGGGRGRIVGALVAQLQERARWDLLEPQPQPLRRLASQPAAEAAAATAVATAHQAAAATRAAGPWRPVAPQPSASHPGLGPAEASGGGGGSGNGSGSGGGAALIGRQASGASSDATGSPAAEAAEGWAAAAAGQLALGLRDPEPAAGGSALPSQSRPSPSPPGHWPPHTGPGGATEGEGRGPFSLRGSLRRRTLSAGTGDGDGGGGGARGGDNGGSSGEQGRGMAQALAEEDCGGGVTGPAAKRQRSQPDADAVSTRLGATAAAAAAAAAAQAEAGPRSGAVEASRGGDNGGGRTSGGGGCSAAGRGSGGAQGQRARVVLGVRGLWVEPGSRRKGLARRLLDAARGCMVPGFAARPAQAAFSALAAEAAGGQDDGGAAFVACARGYVGSPDGRVPLYDEDDAEEEVEDGQG
ncbi:hypothetical protein HYH03_008943 [Edaphochlamys debaryana]|uniref:N-acetyltransferase ESCO acetyl-transferase domain-containing protein n=1 Tax=Edaphochlamys debaryana TaxID=47281 RepID=A0A835XX88_9CHLO|nr:hypothetical protein HYH03_008943 [Edaphochlamys debaryana]|eukprot:KAG2492782.1 hypothetical protein HYH03_008943 [Edaphochlamys debaryana]